MRNVVRSSVQMDIVTASLGSVSVPLDYLDPPVTSHAPNTLGDQTVWKRAPVREVTHKVVMLRYCIIRSFISRSMNLLIRLLIRKEASARY